MEIESNIYENELNNNNDKKISKTDPLYETRILTDKINLSPKETNNINFQDIQEKF